MKTKRCPICGGETKRNGKTAAGTQRFKCLVCSATSTRRIDTDAKLFATFLDWILSRRRMADMPGGGRTFRRKCAKFWAYWAMPPLIDEIHKVVHIDGIYLGRRAVILIARSDSFVLGWYIAKTENSRAYRALMRRIAPPVMVVSDGGSGFAKALKLEWPGTAHQRCTFHAFSQIRRYTTRRPRLVAGIELYELGRDLLGIENLHQAHEWVDRYIAWCVRYDGFLKEQSSPGAKDPYTHQRLVKARNSINALLRNEVLFTYLDPHLTEDGSMPPTNNAIEGAVNAPLRQMLRDHRGLSLMRRIKAVCWWCYMHTERPLAPAQILKVMPTDKQIELYFNALDEKQQFINAMPGWGDAIVWGDFHLSGPDRLEWD
jgi:hypothetical protein